MGTLIRRGIRVLKEEGFRALVRKAARRFLSPVYWTIRQSYTLSIRDVEVQFSVPNQKVMRRNRRRFESERNEIEGLLDELQSDDVFYDIGANTGLYTLFASKVCTEGTVVAFEPYPPNVAVLKRDIARNGADNVEVREIALSDTEGTISFSQPEQADIGYGSASVEADSSATTTEIPTDRGDRLVSEGEIPQPNVVKIDVEGAESLVIEGLKQTLSAPTCRTVYCEAHLPGVDHRPSTEDFGATTADIKDKLKQLGFTVEEDRTRGMEVLFKASK